MGSGDLSQRGPGAEPLAFFIPGYPPRRHRTMGGRMPLVRDIREIGEHRAAGLLPALGFAEVGAAGRSAMRPPSFLLGPANETVLWEIFGQIDTPGVGCYAIEDGLVAPTGIAIKDGVAFHAAAFVQPRHHVVAVCDRLNDDDPPVRHVAGKLAVIYGPAHETGAIG